MSDPVTHAEIEDVLSSIRRLVSEDSRGEPAAPEPAAKLVLTPALRVKEPEPRSPDTAGSPAPDEDAPYLAEASSQVPPGTAPDVQHETPEALPAAGRSTDDECAAAASEEPAAEPAVAFRHRADAYDTGPADLDGTRQDGTGTGADPETGEAEEPGSAEPAAPWTDPAATLFSAASGTPPKKAGTKIAAGEIPAEDQAGGTAGARAASVVRKIAELEARSTVARDQDQQHWEPDSKPEAPFAATLVDTIEWRDEPAPARSAAPADGEAAISDADFRPEPAEAAEDAGETQFGRPRPAGPDTASAADPAETVVEAAFTGAALETLAETGDSYLDEDGLRDLVASIVREELQGPLGERITRNVRKLVRREIHRALAAHDLL
jgi:hypothetical protein